MKWSVILLSLALVLSLAIPLQAKGKNNNKNPSNTLKGEILKIDGGRITVKVGRKSDANVREVIVTTDANTKVTQADGTDARVADLKAGQRITVTPAEGTATRIKIHSEKSTQ